MTRLHKEKIEEIERKILIRKKPSEKMQSKHLRFDEMMKKDL